MKHKKIFLFLMIGTAILTSCKKEKEEYATFNYTVTVGGEKKVVDYASEENRCTFIGYTVHNNGDTLSFFRQIDGCFAPISIKTTENYSSANGTKMHFEGNMDNGLEMFIEGGENYPSPEFICGKVDLSHSDEEYIEGTFSAAFFREYVFIDGDHSNRDYVEDTIWVENGYFKVSVTEVSGQVSYE